LNEESVDAPEDLEENANDEEEAEGIDLQQQQQRYPWEGSDRDYMYDEPLAPFDPTKKKKKKKVVIQDPIEEPTEAQAETSDSLSANDGLDGPSFGTKKKKKKKPIE